MPLKSSRPMATLSSFCVAVVCLALTACAGGGNDTSKVNWEKKVYRIDEQGTKTLVYETDSNGQTTIRDTRTRWPNGKSRLRRWLSRSEREKQRRSQTAAAGPDLCEPGPSGSGRQDAVGGKIKGRGRATNSQRVCFRPHH